MTAYELVRVVRVLEIEYLGLVLADALISKAKVASTPVGHDALSTLLAEPAFHLCRSSFGFSRGTRRPSGSDQRKRFFCLFCFC